MTLILATSAQRPEYARDFLTCLASPDGHRVAFSYQKGWFAPGLLDTPLAGRDGVIVFCDAPDPTAEFDFLAVRRVHVEQLVPASPAGLRDSSAITVAFRLGVLVQVTDAELPNLLKAWNASLRAVEHRPRPLAHAQAAAALFVFEHPALAEVQGMPDYDGSWRVLSEQLGKCTSLRDAFFFRVGALREAGGGELQAEDHGALHGVYPLRPSGEYELPMAAYSKSGKTPYSEAIAVASSSEQLTIQAITQSSAGRASEAVLVVRAGEVKRAQIATLIISGAKGFEYLVPRVEIATRIKPNLALAAALVVAIAVGVVLGGLPKDALGLTELPLYALKLTGGLIVGVSMLLALGRVQGVGR